jgi:hypothetical protein
LRLVIALLLLAAASPTAANLIVDANASKLSGTCRLDSDSGPIEQPAPLDVRPLLHIPEWSTAIGYCGTTVGLSYVVDADSDRITAETYALNARSPDSEPTLLASVDFSVIFDSDGWLRADGTRYWITGFESGDRSGRTQTRVLGGVPYRIVVSSIAWQGYPDDHFDHNAATLQFVAHAPEPGTAALIALGLTAMCGTGRRPAPKRPRRTRAHVDGSCRPRR